MQLKSLVSIEIDTGKSQQGSNQIVDGLHKIDKAADSAKESVGAANQSTKRFFDDFAKTSKNTASIAASSGNKLATSYDKSTAPCIRKRFIKPFSCSNPRRHCFFAIFFGSLN